MHHIFFAALVVTDKIWKQPKYVHEQKNKDIIKMYNRILLHH